MDKICVIIPVYNHAKTIGAVIDGVLHYGLKVFVVNDGSTDNLLDILQIYEEKIELISYPKNKGKGYALKCGFQAAQKENYEYAITLDADGQHRPEDIPLLLSEIEQYPNSLIIGSRKLVHENMPSKSTFANRFSNFWFTVHTGKCLPDTQTGFRLYPLLQMKKMNLATSRYEAELELLVCLAWRGVNIIPVKINVFYPERNERVTHFRPFQDFFRISVLNTVFTFVAIIYGYPRMLINKLKIK